MAAPSKCTLIALLVAFAVVVAPSAAARDGGAAKDAAAAPAPSASGEAVHPTGLIDDIIGGITHLPDLPLPRILPCPPNFPKIPLIPCYNVTPPPPAPPAVTECRPSLAKFMPACGGFLTNGSSVLSPPSAKCCDAIPQLLRDSSPFCFCHVLNGDADELLPAPVNHARALNFLKECGYDIPPETVTHDLCEQGDYTIPPMDAAPSPPPPGRQGTKA